MSNSNEAAADTRPHTPLAHGSRVLPAVSVDTYNGDLRYDDGFVGDRAGRRAFRAILANWRERLKEHGEDPLGGTPTELTTVVRRLMRLAHPLNRRLGLGAHGSSGPVSL